MAKRGKKRKNAQRKRVRGKWCYPDNVSFKPKGEPKVSFKRKCGGKEQKPRSAEALVAKRTFVKAVKECRGGARKAKNKRLFYFKKGGSAYTGCISSYMKDAGVTKEE